MNIINFNKKYKFFYLKNREQLKKWILDSVNCEGKKIREINFVFLSDRELLKRNITHLNHDTFTDVITFDYSNDEEVIEGEILISIERVRENAKKYNKSFDSELDLVMIHGVLHLVGYNDLIDDEEKLMKSKENFYTNRKKI